MARSSLRTIARSYFEDVAPSHDWQHVLRVHKLSLELASTENANTEVVGPAAHLHDIGRKKEDEGVIEDHAQWGADEASRILDDRGFNSSRIDAIAHCISAHRFSNEVEPETLEAKILSDADNLDALGATGVARAFSYSGESGRTLAELNENGTGEPSDRPETALDHLRNKILRLRDRLYTDSAMERANRRHDYVREFVKQLKKEITF